MKNLDRFSVLEVYQNDNNSYKALLKNDQELLRIDMKSNVSEIEAKDEIDSRSFKMKALFETAPAPYPGAISDKIVCGKKLYPQFIDKIIDGMQVSQTIGFLSNRLTWGVCTEEEASYGGIRMLFYCSNIKKFYQLELMVAKETFNSSKEEYLQLPDSLRCKK